ncbi:hypothetical protein [Ancylomarina longa]|nr:hypothetical protein [Ancylomarina longa]
MSVGKGLCCIVGVLLVLVACDDSKQELDVQIINPVNIEENAMINCILEDVVNEVEFNLMAAGEGMNTKGDSVPQVKISRQEAQASPSSIILDYGTGNQKDYLGREKRGKICNEISGRYDTGTCKQEIHFEDFYINDLKINGSIEVQSTGFNDNDQLSFTINYQDIVFESTNGKTYTISGSKTKEWVVGYDTPSNPWDDQFLVSGSGSGIDSEERAYHFELSTPLLISQSCEFILSGEVAFTVENDSCTYNFGDGLCDNKGSYEVNGSRKNFEFGRYTFRYNY